MSDPTQPSAPDFASRDPNSPEFWDERFERQFMPWDQAGVPPGVRLRLALESLGPIFVKFGQVLSTRRDLLPVDIANED